MMVNIELAKCLWGEKFFNRAEELATQTAKAIQTVDPQYNAYVGPVEVMLAAISLILTQQHKARSLE